MPETMSNAELLASLPPLPPKHRLSYYRTLGLVKGLLMCLGSSANEAEAEAVIKLRRCRPDRPHRVVAGGVRRHADTELP